MAGSSTEADIEVTEEVEALEATLLEGILIRRDIEGSERPTQLELSLSPLTASDEERAYVSLTLKVTIPSGYPSESPKLSISNPRGLGESSLLSLEEGLRKKCEEYCGDPVLYELVEHTREFLTEFNVPACSCAVCLCDIKEQDSFIKTPCYHYFHSLCYGTYIQSETSAKSEEIQDLKCPVCRETLIMDVLNYDFSHLLKSPPPVVQVSESLTLTEDLRKLQESMKSLFDKQKSNGAIIDVEAENSKSIVSIVGESDGPRPSGSASLTPVDIPGGGSTINNNNNNVSNGNKSKPRSKKTVTSSLVTKNSEHTTSSSEVARNEDPRRLARYKKYQSHNVSRHQMHKNMKASKSSHEGPGNL